MTIHTNRKCIFLCLTIPFVLLFPTGCHDRETPITAPGSTSVADEALSEAEAMLQEADLSLSFEGPGDLVHLERFVPEPVDLADAGKQRSFAAIIEKLNIVVDELERGDSFEPLGSVSDRALVHLYLGFVYTFDAVSRLLISDDPAETFIIEHAIDSSGNPWYNIDVSAPIKAKLDATKDPLQYPLAFTSKERQAIIDAADLIDDAIVKPKDSDIKPLLSSVDQPPYSRYALWHLEKAARLFDLYDPDVRDSIEKLIQQLDETRAELQDRSEGWGFTYTLPPWR